MTDGKPASAPLKWASRIVLALLAPLVILAVLEGGLALAGRGRATDFLVPLSDDGWYYSNPDFGVTYFGADLNRHPGEIRLAATKPDNAYRIFVLGGSAAFGTPDTAFSFARVLEAMLVQRFPDTRFEVVNTGMVAVNSHVVLRIARECREFDPDLFIVYMGNNEVVGPYGPGTALLNFQPSLRAIGAQIALRRTRIAQWMDGLSMRDVPREWQGMNMFLEHRVPADDPRLPHVYENFEANLRRLCRGARGASVPVLLSTVIVNLEDLPPFASVHRDALTRTEEARWRELFDQGAALENDGRWEKARRAFAQAEQIDDGHAELQYRAGRCDLALGRSDAARERFLRARDLDALRFRADSRINEIIRETANELAAHDVHLADAAGEVTSPDGEDLFYEHVHFTFEGNYQLAGFLYPKVVELLSLPLGEDGEGVAGPPSREACAAWLAYTPHARFTGREKINELTGRPPFPAARRAHDRVALERCRSALTPPALAAMAEAVEARVSAREDDVYLHVVHGRLKMFPGGDAAAAAESFRRGLAIYPPGANLRFLLGKALLAGGRAAEAEQALRRVLEGVPNNAQVLQYLGQARHALGDSQEALGLLGRALDLTPENPGLLVSIGRIHLMDRHGRDAVDYYRKAIALDPDWAEAHAELGVCLGMLDDHRAALVSLRQAAELRPDAADIHYQLAMAYARLSQPDAAHVHYRKAVALDPGYEERPVTGGDAP